jgi:RNA polymerase sigma-70 factor (ECF subfamily)
LRSSDSPGEAHNDNELVSRVCAGETHLFEQLVRRNQDSVYGMALRLLRDPGEAEDVAQEVFLRAFRGLQSFHGASKLSTWLYRITFNLCTDCLRKRKRRDLPCHGVPAPDRLPDSAPDLEGRLQEAEERATIRAAVHELKEIYRIPIVLHYYQGLSQEEISAATGLPSKTVETRLYRARKLLRERLEKAGVADLARTSPPRRPAQACPSPMPR